MKKSLLTFVILYTLSACKIVTQQQAPATNPVFTTTTGLYSETANLDSAVKAELGPNARVADWATDIKTYCTTHPVDSLLAMIKWSPWDTTGGRTIDTTRQNYFVLSNGQGFWSQDPSRHYFATQFDHNVPSTWLVHDQIDSSEIVEGSWFKIRFKVLAVTP
jgi:hypothetical protein